MTSVAFELPGDTDGQALAGELVDDAQHPERLSIVGAVGDEVIGPDMVGTLRPQTDARSVVEPETSAFRLFGGTFSPSHRQIRSTRFLFTVQPPLRSSAVIRRYP